MEMKTFSVDSGSPITQSLSAVVELLNRLGRAARENSEAEPLELISIGGFKPVLE
jgi:hypothetical protein